SFKGWWNVVPTGGGVTADSLTLIGGRLDYIDSDPVAVIVYQCRKHVINLFVAQHLGRRHARTIGDSIQGYNVRHWSQDGLDPWAVSDIVGDELDEFVRKIASALRQPSHAS